MGAEEDFWESHATSHSFSASCLHLKMRLLRFLLQPSRLPRSPAMRTLSLLELYAQVNLFFFMWPLVMVFITPTESNWDTQWGLEMMLTTAFWLCGQLAWLSHVAFCPECMCMCMCVCALVLISGSLTYTYSCGCLDYDTTVGACLEEHPCPRTWCDVCTCHPQLQGVTLDFAHHFVHIIGSTEIFHIFHPRAAIQKRNKIFLTLSSTGYKW